MGVKRIHIKIVYACFGMVAGFSAFVAWNIEYEQPWTAAMGGLSGKCCKHSIRGCRSQIQHMSDHIIDQTHL